MIIHAIGDDIKQVHHEVLPSVMSVDWYVSKSLFNASKPAARSKEYAGDSFNAQKRFKRSQGLLLVLVLPQFILLHLKGPIYLSISANRLDMRALKCFLSIKKTRRFHQLIPCIVLLKSFPA